MTSSSPGRRPTTAWKAKGRRALALAWAAVVCLPAAGLPAEEPEGGTCVRVGRYEAALEGQGLRVRGEVANGCPYVVRNVRVEVETRDQQGQVLGTGEGFVDPTVLGVQDVGRFDVPVAATVLPAAVNITATWRRFRY